MLKKKEIRVNSRSLGRRLKFEGDARYFINRLHSKVQSGGWDIGKWFEVLLRLLVRSSIVVFDLLEVVRSKDNTFSIGDPRRAIIHTSRRLSQHPRFIGYWYDSQRHAAVGMHLGADLIRHRGRFYINELNLDAAMRPQRRCLYDAAIDPVLSGIFRVAQAHGFRRVVLCVGPWREAYSAEAAQAGRQYGLEVTVSSTRHWPHAEHPYMPGLPIPLEEYTLYVIFSGRHTPLDYLVHDKYGSDTWVRNLANEQPEHAQLVSGIHTSDKLFVPPSGASDQWPNLVVKLAGWDMGRFVLFAKVRDENEARTSLGLERDGQIPKAFGQSVQERLLTYLQRQGPVLYQAYIPPDLTESGHIQTYRLHLFVSPLVDSFLSVHGVVSSTRVPESLPFGIVADTSPYITNFSLGAHYTLLDKQTDADIARVATQIGKSLKGALALKLETETVGSASR